MFNTWLNRTEMLIGSENINLLKNANVVVFGLGGVGSYVVEGLVRTGIENIAIIDKDIIDITNINRQLIADTSTISLPKVDVAKRRILTINPDANIYKIKEFVNKNNISQIMKYIDSKFDSKNQIEASDDLKTSKKISCNSHIDYVIDAIDTVSSKIEIIKYCYANNINIISCMGTGNKLDANKFEITDITKTSVCPLAKVIRKELKKLNIPHLKVLYSKETPIKTNTSTPASISFVPSVAGLLIAGEVVKSIITTDIRCKQYSFCKKRYQ